MAATFFSVELSTTHPGVLASLPWPSLPGLCGNVHTSPPWSAMLLQVCPRGSSTHTKDPSPNGPSHGTTLHLPFPDLSSYVTPTFNTSLHTILAESPLGLSSPPRSLPPASSQSPPYLCPWSIADISPLAVLHIFACIFSFELIINTLWKIPCLCLHTVGAPFLHPNKSLISLYDLTLNFTEGDYYHTSEFSSQGTIILVSLLKTHFYNIAVRCFIVNFKFYPTVLIRVVRCSVRGNCTMKHTNRVKRRMCLNKPSGRYSINNWPRAAGTRVEGTAVSTYKLHRPRRRVCAHCVPLSVCFQQLSVWNENESHFRLKG